MGFFSSCDEKAAPMQGLVIDNHLTDAEKAAGLFTPEVMWKMGRIGDYLLSPDGTTVLYSATYYNMEENRSVSNLYTVPVEGGAPVQLTDNGGKDFSPQYAADGKTIYFLSDRSGDVQLWVLREGKVAQLTNIENGIEGYGIAPSGEKIWYARRVQVDPMTKDVYPDASKSSAMIYDDLMVRHWDRWEDGSYSHIFVADFDGSKLSNEKDILAGESWDAPMAPYFETSEISWNPTGTVLAYTCKKLRGAEYAVSTDSDVFLYDVATGTTRNVTAGMHGYDKYPRFSPDGTKVAFSSMERAGNESDKSRLMVCDLASGQITYLTRDFDYNADQVDWDGNDALMFIAPIRATHQICRATLDGAVKVLTEGRHDFNGFSKVGDQIVAPKTTLSMATELFVVDPASGTDRQVTFENKEIYETIKMGEVQERIVRTSDGKEMLVWVVLPPDFDPAKKYPALLYCQGGPQSVVSQFWSFRWNFQLMAAQGYVVVAPNRRGLPSFGQEWLDQISGDYSGQNIRDYLSAIDDVAKEPWIDAEKLGCVGASYGGYSVYYLMGNHQKRFKAFIAHCGMFNFESMYGSTEELWFPNNDLGGSYWSDNPTAKRSYANSPHKFVQNWDTPLLIFSGLNDFRIPYTENLQAFTAARLMGVPARLVTFSDEAHQIFKPQNSLVWNREFFTWLNRYVKGEPVPN